MDEKTRKINRAISALKEIIFRLRQSEAVLKELGVENTEEINRMIVMLEGEISELQKQTIQFPRGGIVHSQGKPSRLGEQESVIPSHLTKRGSSPSTPSPSETLPEEK